MLKITYLICCKNRLNENTQNETYKPNFAVRKILKENTQHET